MISLRNIGWVGVFLLLAGRAQAGPDSIPRPVGYVNDYEGLFTTAQKDILENMIHDFEKKTSIEIAVVTIDSSLTMAANFDVFTLKMMKSWGVGKKDKNNGILIGLSKTYRKIRIQNGSGLMKLLPDVETKKIIDEAFLPFFRKGLYYEGVLDGLKTLIQRLE